MNALVVCDVLKDPILVSRESARLLEAPLRLLDVGSIVTVDFNGVEGISPSFFDELLTVYESVLGDALIDIFQLIIDNPPTELSSKFVAVARSHQMVIHHVDSNKSWILNPKK